MKDAISFHYKLILGLFFVSFSTLLLELNLIKLFDVILTPSLAYMVISSAIFAFGLAGIILSIWPIQRNPAKSQSKLLLWDPNQAQNCPGCLILLVSAKSYS